MRKALTLALGLMPCPAAAEPSLYEAAGTLDLYPCELSSLSCTTLTLPLDHRANDPTQTIDITFALSFASVESRGILFYFVGGPGGSGLAAAENYLASFDESLSEYMDIVFVDQRGTGPVHGLACPVAQARFDVAPVSLDDPATVKDAARSFVSDCTAELDADTLLGVVNTDQAIRDFEAFRQAIGAPKVWLYGESYGTQIAQSYAAAYPQAVSGVILDGVVDLTLDAEGFYARYTLAAERLLDQTLAACADIPACAVDMAGDAAAIYDRLAQQVATDPPEVPLPLSDGTAVPRKLTPGLLEANAFYALYSAEGRADFLRALAAAGRGNLLPMLHLGYFNMYIDPETELGLEDPGWFGAAFYAVTCSDYDSGEGSADQRADRIIAEAQAMQPKAPRLLRSYFLERLACAYWPHQGPADRPPAYAGGDWPTLILNGESDPITPISMAYSVLDRARNAYGIFLKGGSHVIWGRGLACPDVIVQELLYHGIMPDAREQLCEQDLIAEYTPLTLVNPARMSDPLAVSRAVETELTQLIPLQGWDGYTPQSFGCPFGGTIAVEALDAGTGYRFGQCSFWDGLALDGTGEEISTGEADDGLSLVLTASGLQTGEIVYRHNPTKGSFSISGLWNGRPASLPRVAE